MNDAVYEVQKQRVLTCFDRWNHLLWLHWWRVEFVWHRGPLDHPDGHFFTIMRCQAQWASTLATIDVSLTEVEGLDDDTLERCVVHGCGHPIVNEMRDYEKDHGREERVVSWLERAFLSVYYEGHVWPAQAEEIIGRWQAALNV